MPVEMQAEMAARLVEIIGDEEAAIIECWRLATANGWRTEAGRAEAFMRTPLGKASPPKLLLHVGWHGAKIGALSHDGSGWRWEPTATEGATPVRSRLPGRLPPFIESLLPEGWLARVLRSKTERERISAGRRYMSNIVVSENADDLQALPSDVLEGRLDAFTSKGTFAGGYAGPAPSVRRDARRTHGCIVCVGVDPATVGRSDQGANESLARRHVAAGQ